MRQGEAQAVLEKLAEFLQQGISNYSQGRNHPALECTTRLSPHLHYGEISAREVWHRARSAADASPYFRIFNPVIQGQKFDAEGAYIRHWVPELGGLSNRYLNCPWEAPPEALQEAGISLGKDYPHPIVEHKAARENALAALASLGAP